MTAPIRISRLTSVQSAYLAGLIDGEGTITLTRMHPRETEHLPERRRMMQGWADYLDGLKVGAEVISIHGRAA